MVPWGPRHRPGVTVLGIQALATDRAVRHGDPADEKRLESLKAAVPAAEFENWIATRNRNHRLHLEGDPLTGRTGTSCFTCHASHGSRTEESLLRFNPEAVDADPVSRRIDHRPEAPRAGACYLSCHGYDHSPGVYR